MANVYAVKSGNWSDTTVWNTSALPTSADDVYANNKSVNIDINPYVNLLTTLSGLSSLGGRFYIQPDVSLSANRIECGTTTVVTFLCASPWSCSVYGGLFYGGNITDNTAAILNNSTGTMFIAGTA